MEVVELQAATADGNRESSVDIFAPAGEDDIVNVAEQRAFFKKCVKSIRGRD